ncbi:MAG: threonylcarbamoyl-AMP synthase [Acidimicrobiaceae bacterium]|nr:threonylcarbamoyl-AMP synthase [Acidimicrobiaceae bacterium]MYK74142.1 threonylcarbamoyl-AMP synthase [Acidimicrobiaceae bacterium]
MTGGRVLSTRTLEQRENAVDAALSALRRGEPVGVPTDTVYGLAADADAIQQLFELKERPAERSIAVLVADLAAAETLVELTPSARRLAERFWPGPLTIVAARRSDAPAHLGAGATIGVRLPGDDIMQAIAGLGPLAVTSANLHGGRTPSTAQGVADLFPTLSLIVDGGPRPGAPSTVVDVTGSTPAVLREGSVTPQKILDAFHDI